MDIDDILAAVGAGRAAVPPETQDLQALTRAWVNEKGAPELLPWPAALMERVAARLRRQIAAVEEQAAAPDPAASFRLVIVQTELERVKFVVRSLLRARIAKDKIDRYALHYLNDAAARAHLAPSELEYATTHQALLAAHYGASFLGQFPASLQRLDDTAGGIAMVEQPDLDRAVFVRALVDAEDTDPVRVSGTDIAFEFRRGDVYVVRWSAVREHVERGEAELL